MRLLYLIIAVAFSSCAFNKLFLVPTVVEDASKTYTLRDSSTVSFAPETLQPEFKDSLGKVIDLGYDLESFKFESSSGNILNGWFLKSKKPADITLLHFHGNAGFLLSQIKAIDPLIEYGFQIFMFDYSGFGLSEGEATRKNVLKDGNSALDYVLMREESINTKLVIYGQSLGGHLAATVGAQREDDIDGLVIEGAFASHSKIAGKRVPVLGNVFVREMYSGKRYLMHFNKPVLIIHSTEDQTIPFKHGLKLHQKANDPKDFMKIDKCHICGPSYYAKEIAARIRKMFN